MYEELKTKYRPADFDMVIGQPSVVAALEHMAASAAWPHCFLFNGPSGVGKTTLARIIFHRYLAMSPSTVIEVDAATTNSVESVRELTRSIHTPGMGTARNKGWILDECHRYSKPAWDAFLKSTEEPPPHAYFCFCTTELEKVPKTIQTRAVVFHLTAVSQRELEDFATVVIELEQLTFPDDAIPVLVREAGGSPRALLTKLERCRGLTERAAILHALQLPDESGDIVALCRELIKADPSWPTLLAKLAALDPAVNAESVRIIVTAYVGKVVMGCAHDGPKTARLLNVLHAFNTPYAASDKLAPLLLSLGRVCFDADD